MHGDPRDPLGRTRMLVDKAERHARCARWAAFAAVALSALSFAEAARVLYLRAVLSW